MYVSAKFFYMESINHKKLLKDYSPNTANMLLFIFEWILILLLQAVTVL